MSRLKKNWRSVSQKPENKQKAKSTPPFPGPTGKGGVLLFLILAARCGHGSVRSRKKCAHASSSDFVQKPHS